MNYNSIISRASRNSFQFFSFSEILIIELLESDYGITQKKKRKEKKQSNFGKIYVYSFTKVESDIVSLAIFIAIYF